MSDFECRNGHLMRPGVFRCPECGGGLYTMDGQTSREIEARERDMERREREERWDEFHRDEEPEDEDGEDEG